ncbi:MAG: ATP synthase F1 subunit delta [Candidatus Cloacimonas sp.]|nr:ATP synthase F1 subunit delta [Candidatus Cloacimonadota bacterium]
MKDLLIANRYAQALVRTIPKEEYDSLLQDVKALQKQFTDLPELGKYLNSRIVDREERKEVVNMLVSGLNHQKKWYNLYVLMEKKHRMTQVEKILFETEKIVLDLQDKKKMTLTLARKHSDSVVKSIVDYVSTTVGKELVIEQEIDPEIIGGFIAKVGSTNIDGSIKSKLSQLEKVTDN